MPSKSDSAGKIHEYFTYLEIKAFYGIEGTSPFDNNKQLPTSDFSDEELEGLKVASQKTFEIVKSKLQEFPLNPPIRVDHIGGHSGAGKQDVTDDLKITLQDGGEIVFSLKCAKDGFPSVLSRNMGAKTLLSLYFKAPSEQEKFNIFLEKEYLNFLNMSFEFNSDSVKSAKKLVSEKIKTDGYNKARFEYYDVANIQRSLFLKKLQCKLLELMEEISIENRINAANLILDTGTPLIFATYGNNPKADLHLNSKLEEEGFLGIESRGNDSVVIKFRDFNIGFRYKFESAITSSIKLVGDYSENKNPNSTIVVSIEP